MTPPLKGEGELLTFYWGSIVEEGDIYEEGMYFSIFYCLIGREAKWGKMKIVVWGVNCDGKGRRVKEKDKVGKKRNYEEGGGGGMCPACGGEEEVLY